MPHSEFMERIKKSLYYGPGTSYRKMAASQPLAEYASELFSEPHRGYSLNRLNTVTAGNIRANPCCLIMALIYLDRLQASDPNYVRRITPSELFIVSVMISTKLQYEYEEEISIADWAAEVHTTEDHIKQLELEFLDAIDWNIHISNDQFFEKLNVVEKVLAHREGLRRGWLTYAELLNFLPSFTLARFLFNNITIMAVSYAASVMTIAGAFFLVSHMPGNALTNKENNVLIEHNNLDQNASSAGNAIYTSGYIREENGTVNDNSITHCTFMNVPEKLENLESNYYNAEENSASKNNESTGPLINLNENYILKKSKIEVETSVDRNKFKDEYDCKRVENCSQIAFWDIIDRNIRNIRDPLLKMKFIWFKFI